MKTAAQGCHFHGSSAAIMGTPSCVFVMRHIRLTKGFLQADSVPDATRPVGKIHPFSKMAVTFEPLMGF